MRRASEPRWAVAVSAALVVAVVSGVFVSHYGGYTLQAGAPPLSLSGDALTMVASLKACAESTRVCLAAGVNSHLGAPVGAVWADFPRSEDLWYFVGGLLVRAFDVGRAANLMVLLAMLSLALTTFAVARSMRIALPLAVAVAVLVGCSTFMFVRELVHLNVALSVAAPLMVFVWRSLAQRAEWALRSRPMVWLAAGLIGLQMVYYAAFFAFGALALALWHLLARRWFALRRIALSLAAMAVGLTLGNLDSLSVRLSQGPNPQAVVRGRVEGTTFGLFPEQLFIPPTEHRVEWVRSLAAKYPKQYARDGEYPSPYLGLVGGAALLALIGTGLWRLRTRRFGRTSALALFTLFMVLVVYRFGLITIANWFIGTSMLRSNNRFSLVLLIVALLWAAARVSRVRRVRTSPLVGWVGAALVMALGLFDAVPQSALTEAKVLEQQTHWQRVKAMVGELEAKTVEGCRGVFVWPPQAYPETQQAPLGDQYAPFALYMHSSTLQFSYGGIRGRESGQWPFDAVKLGNEGFVRALIEKRFCALVTNRVACDGTCQSGLQRLFGRLAPNNRVDDVEPGGWFGWYWGPQASLPPPPGAAPALLP